MRSFPSSENHVTNMTTHVLICHEILDSLRASYNSGYQNESQWDPTYSQTFLQGPFEATLES
jgi:hypothetical protein